MKEFEPDDQLAEAFARLDLIRIADALGIQLKNGAQKSPFRDDKRPSFSVFDHGKRAKDHATDEVFGAWKFVEIARPEWDKAARAKFLIELSGQTPSSGPRITKAEKKERLRDRTLERYRARRAEAAKVAPVPDHQPWPAIVRDHYAEGYLTLKKDKNAQSRIGEERGWYDYTVEQLVETGKIANPLLPWSNRSRGVAFTVEAPPPNRGETPPILGYHQRYVRGTGKVWLYCPHAPTNPRNEYTIALDKLRMTCPAFPFFLGNTTDPSLVVVLEGQWDAVSFWAACGGLYSEAEKHMAVFGLRGASSANIFLSAYRHLLHTTHPTVWLIGDNDEAGRRWTTAPAAAHGSQPGTLRSPSFSDRLVANGAGRLVTTFLKADGIKDFNDYYFRAMPEPADMANFFKKAGVEWAG